MKDENLEETEFGYVYYMHSKHPLVIELEKTVDLIKVTVIKFYKNIEIKRLTKQSKIVKPMTKEQVEEYICDVAYLFIDGKKD